MVVLTSIVRKLFSVYTALMMLIFNSKLLDNWANLAP